MSNSTVKKEIPKGDNNPPASKRKSIVIFVSVIASEINHDRSKKRRCTAEENIAWF